MPPGISGTNDRCTVLVSNLNSDVSFCLFVHRYFDVQHQFLFLLKKRMEVLTMPKSFAYFPGLVLVNRELMRTSCLTCSPSMVIL